MHLIILNLTIAVSLALLRYNVYVHLSIYKNGVRGDSFERKAGNFSNTVHNLIPFFFCNANY